MAPAILAIGTRQLGKNLREAYVGEVKSKGLEAGEKEFRSNVTQLVRKSGYDAFSFKGLIEGIMGENWAEKYKQGCRHLQMGLRESISAVDVSAFSNITGQILISRILENYNSPEFICDQLMETIPVTGGNLGPEIIPWLSRVRNPPSILGPQQEYPETNFIEQYITLAAPEKRGLKCAVSMEMVYADKTKQALLQAEDIGHATRLDKEERQMRTIIGVNNNFTYMGTTYNTYALSGLWINKIANNPIVNYGQVAALELLFANMTDFVTGKPIMVNPKNVKILCTPTKLPELKIALHASMTRSGAYSPSNPNTQQDYNGVPLINDVDYPLVKSQLLWYLLTTPAPIGLGLSPTNAKEYVFMSDFQKAFYYREVVPFTMVQAPPGNPAEFDQDIVIQVKTMEWGVSGVQRPQMALWSYLA